jgi:lipid-A-disaccharide synthase
VQVAIGAPISIDEDIYGDSPFPLTHPAVELLHFATAALVKSGTTTLETALAGTPFVVAYKMNPLSFQVARRVVRVPHIALANLVANRRVVAEFVQGEATPPKLADAILPLLFDGDARRRTIEGLREVRTRLRKGGAAERVAEMATELLMAG